MAQQVEEFATKPDDPSSILGTQLNPQSCLLTITCVPRKTSKL